ncbi:flagellar biosynthesis protein FlhA [Microbulbifer sp. SAOS-129_SWC]|uniref:flagellar biosynthesis protein FlhA n=1 Tax=Microbulbifer sp. SAOS-129_SWC TaxID=3145235 RepID=UPI0032173E5E
MWWNKNFLSGHSDLLLVLAMVGILMVLFTPIPSVLLDFLLVLNVSFALLILLLTFYVEKPTNFSTFPSLLLMATLFRLSLNIAATRLILNDTDAGRVIGAIGDHVVSGNYVIGLIVFLVLIVVQYVVVTNGAQRVAEVSARFTLDSMPGKQMSIDADLNIGLINEEEAKKRREGIEKESNFYGSMDGASKFVKGDAIAGIIIILIDIVGGLTIGVAQKGMSWSEALHTFTLLTVGDGIVTQIPALIISTGTGIIVTRATSDAFLSQEIGKQITSFPKILLLIALALILILFLPGLPILPVLMVLLLVSILGYFAVFQGNKTDLEEDQPKQLENNVYDTLTVDPLVIEIGAALKDGFSTDSSFNERIATFRKKIARETGFVVPSVKVRDGEGLNDAEYRISINDVPIGSGQLYMEKWLAINPGNIPQTLDGIDTKEPTYGLPAKWIEDESVDVAESMGYTIVDPTSVLITHLGEVIKGASSDLMSRKEVELMINQLRPEYTTLIDELIPSLMTLSDVQKVLQKLLSEQVSIRNMPMILEVLVDQARFNKEPGFLASRVREQLSAQICRGLANENGELFVMVLDPAVERTVGESLSRVQEGRPILDAKFSEQLLKRIATNVEKMMSANINPVLLCNQALRSYMRDFSEKAIPQLSVLSMSEVNNNVKLKSFGVVSV